MSMRLIFGDDHVSTFFSRIDTDRGPNIDFRTQSFQKQIAEYDIKTTLQLHLQRVKYNSFLGTGNKPEDGSGWEQKMAGCDTYKLFLSPYQVGGNLKGNKFN